MVAKNEGKRTDILNMPVVYEHFFYSKWKRRGLHLRIHLIGNNIPIYTVLADPWKIIIVSGP